MKYKRFDMEKFIAAAITISATLLFALGYFYLNSYFSTLGVSMLEIDYTIYDIIAHSIVAIRSTLDFEFFALLFFAVVTSYLIYNNFVNICTAIHPSLKLRNPENKRRLLGALCALLIFAASVTDAIATSISVGRQRAGNDIQFGKRLWVEIDQKNLGILAPLKQEGSSLNFVTATRKYIFASINFADGRDKWILRLDRETAKNMRIFTYE